MTNFTLHARQQLLSDLGAAGLLLVHGGAGPQDPKGERATQAQSALKAALEPHAQPWHPSWEGAAHKTLAAMATLAQHNTSEAERKSPHNADGTHTARGLKAVAVLERHPLLNAGFGAALQADGQTRVSAAVMESLSRKFSSVINVVDCMHPSVLAGHLQTHYHSMLDGTGAAQLMSQIGVPHSNLTTHDRFEQFVEKRRQTLGESESLRWRSEGTGTVGAVTVTPEGHLSAITSTGGVGFEPTGRIGDSGTVSGTYADQQTAISCTGYGEQITDLGFAVRTAVLCQTGWSLEEAMRHSLAEAAARGFGLAAIAANVRDGRVSWCMGTTESYFVWAWRTGEASSDFLIALQDDSPSHSLLS
jgi:L-asparaginase